MPDYAHLYHFFKGTHTDTSTSLSFKSVLTPKLSHYVQVECLCSVCLVLFVPHYQSFISGQKLLTPPYTDLAAAGYAHLIIPVTNHALAHLDSGLSVSPAAAALAGSQTFYITCFSLQNLKLKPSVKLSDANGLLMWSSSTCYI